MRKSQRFWLIAILCLILTPGTHSLLWAKKKNEIKNTPIDRELILAEADLERGKSIYMDGKRLDGAHLAFSGGPHWLRSQGGGCATCHGSNGLGDIQPDFCFLTTPPITYKFLVGDGYPFSTRQDGSHPAYTTKTLQRAIEAGIRSNGLEMDYCMPRWRLSDTDFKDLLGYILSLDNKK